MPNISFDSLEAVPEGLREFAKNTDGKFVVDVVPGAKLNEFRDNNIRLSQERDNLAGIFQKLRPVVGEDLDTFLSSYQNMAEVAQKVKDGTLKTTDDITKEVENRVSAMKNGYENQLSQAQKDKVAAQEALTAANNKYNRSVIDRAVTEAVINPNSGANPEALKHILTNAYEVFQVTPSGQLIAKDGDATIYGSNGADPMTPAEWLGRLRETAPFFFKNSNGGGATGGGQGGNDKYGGMTKADFDKLAPEKKLAIWHAQQAKGKK